MKLKRPVSGKILQHSRGMGVPTEETVERRAAELALIKGREEVTEADRTEAFRELHGGYHRVPPVDGDMPEVFSVREVMLPQNDHVVSVGTEERSIGEELVEEGLDEAEHDQMLASRREIDLPLEREEE